MRKKCERSGKKPSECIPFDNCPTIYKSVLNRCIRCSISFEFDRLISARGEVSRRNGNICKWVSRNYQSSRVSIYPCIFPRSIGTVEIELCSCAARIVHNDNPCWRCSQIGHIRRSSSRHRRLARLCGRHSKRRKFGEGETRHCIPLVLVAIRGAQ